VTTPASPGATEVRPARASDRDAIERLLRDASLPLDGLDDAWRSVFMVAEQNGHVVGGIGLERHDDAALLRSAIVAADVRGQRVGEQLVRALLDGADHAGLTEVWLLTTTAEAWFPRFGFARAPRSAMPEALGASAELRGACPDSAVPMVRVHGGRDQ
jgi:amino-acid N-acetyltransferase